jgi:RNA-directed DNA polymerase
LKTYKNLWEKFVSFENLFEATKKAEQHKRYKPEVLKFNSDLENNLLLLKKELESGSYFPGEYRYFKIFEPKERDIYAAPYKDRVVHHAVINIIEPIWEQRFYYHSYACRVNKGMHKAIDVCQEYLKQNKYVLKCDIKKFFQSIDHDILKGIIGKRIKDNKLMRIIELIIDQSPEMESPQIFFPEDDFISFLEHKNGIPIGNLTSQFFANLYLSELDTWLKHSKNIKFYLRYMDDFVIFHNSKKFLQNLKEELTEFLNSLRLSLHPKKSQIFPAKNGIAFLGFHILPNLRRLRQENIRRFIKRIKEHQRLFSKFEIDSEHIKQSINAWKGHAAHGDTKELIGKLLYQFSFKRNNVNRSNKLPIVCCGAVTGTTIQPTTTYARGIATTTTRPTATTTSAFVVPILNNISDRELYGAFGEKRSPDLFRL